MLHRYLVVIVAGISLLLGIQVPNFVDQYAKRLDAHLLEVMQNIHPYQVITDKYYSGNIEHLIEFHKKNTIKTFREEGAAIERMYKRKLTFENDQAAFTTHLPWKVAHILFNGDGELLHETVTSH
jgi:hypothetical protein